MGLSGTDKLAYAEFQALISHPHFCSVQVAPVLQQVVEAYGCSLVEGVLSHQLKQFVIDGNKCVLNKVSTP